MIIALIKMMIEIKAISEPAKFDIKGALINAFNAQWIRMAGDRNLIFPGKKKFSSFFVNNLKTFTKLAHCR
jgi:hypothetical protein